jgi:hypothetical protein
MTFKAIEGVEAARTFVREAILRIFEAQGEKEGAEGFILVRVNV